MNLQSLTVPPTITVPQAGLVIIRPQTNCPWVVWDSSDSGFQIIPSDLLASHHSIKLLIWPLKVIQWVLLVFLSHPQVVPTFERYRQSLLLGGCGRQRQGQAICGNLRLDGLAHLAILDSVVCCKWVLSIFLCVMARRIPTRIQPQRQPGHRSHQSSSDPVWDGTEHALEWNH
jgi:hypothetical protein